jgi:osmoprotectant transport system ATP-binding protein
MLELAGVCKRYGDVEALHPTDLAVGPAETVVLLGPSGCGKSTLLRLAIGLVSPDRGAVRFEGETLTPAAYRRARERMGYVIQEGGLFPHLTVRENVLLMARYLGRDPAWRDERLAALADLVRLPPATMSRYPLELSGGQRQRVSLMRALMLDPDLLLLDEPLGALDPMIRYGLQQELKSIFAGLGKAVVMVTHDIAEAAFFGDRIVLMREGRIVQQGTMSDLAGAPAEAFVCDFINAQRAPFEKLHEVLD